MAVANDHPVLAIQTLQESTQTVAMTAAPSFMAK